MVRACGWWAAWVAVVLRLQEGQACAPNLFSVGIQKYRKVTLIGTSFKGPLVIVNDYKITGIGVAEQKLMNIIVTYPEVVSNVKLKNMNESSQINVFQNDNLSCVVLQHTKASGQEPKPSLLHITVKYSYGLDEKQWILEESDFNYPTEFLTLGVTFFVCNPTLDSAMYLDEDNRVNIHTTNDAKINTRYPVEAQAITYFEGFFYVITEDQMQRVRDNFKEPIQTVFTYSERLNKVYSIVFDFAGDLFVCYEDGILFHRMWDSPDYRSTPDIPSCRAMVFFENDVFIDTGLDFSRYSRMPFIKIDNYTTTKKPTTTTTTTTTTQSTRITETTTKTTTKPISTTEEPYSGRMPHDWEDYYGRRWPQDPWVEVMITAGFVTVFALILLFVLCFVRYRVIRDTELSAEML